MYASLYGGKSQTDHYTRLLKDKPCDGAICRSFDPWIGSHESSWVNLQKNNCPEVVKQVATERIANIDKIYSVLFKYRT